MEQYNVMGMSCAACVSRVEKAVSNVEGVESCAVSLLTNSMGVEGSASPKDIIDAVRQAGYDAVQKGNDFTASDGPTTQNDSFLEDTETPKLKRRLFYSLGFWLLLMYMSMGHMMWNWPLPKAIADNHIAMGITQMLLTIIIMLINQKFFVSGFKSLWHLSPNMDTLVALGSSAAFGYSLFALYAMTDAQLHGDMQGVMSYMMEFYFESAATILTLITVGKMLEARSKGKTTDALKGLMKLAPKNATVIRNGEEIVILASQVQVDDIFVVKPGESIPVDGIVMDGNSAVNESSLTGESIPVDKKINDSVSAATINQSGFLTCRATRVGNDTTLSQIIKMVSDAAATKAPIAKIADRVSGVFVPTVILISIIDIIVWLFIGKGIGFALARGISVLVISCPCALGLATPVAIMVGNGLGAKNGILFKTAVSLEELGRVDIVALDKTGTITNGEPVVTDLICAENVTENELLMLAYSLEAKSEHPLAKAVVKKAKQQAIAADDVTEFEILPGNGLKGMHFNAELVGGSIAYMQSLMELPSEIKKQAVRLAKDGKTPLVFAKDHNVIGMIAVADTIKDDSKEAIRQLKQMGIRVVMLTGDNVETAQAIGTQVDVDDVIAGVLPGGKEKTIQKLKQDGKVAMVGDGINDAPALTRADIGIAIGSGTDVAIDAADIVLMKNQLLDVPAAIRMSRATLRNIHQNLFWAFFYNTIGIPLAAGLFIPFGLTLNPMFGAAAMSLSSFCVVSNALRLNLFRLYDASRDKRRTVKKKKLKNQKEKMEDKKMEKTMKIEGMMCGHCEARVKKTLEAIAQVDEAVVSHEAGTAVVKLNADITNDELKQAVEAQDYKVVEIL